MSEELTTVQSNERSHFTIIPNFIFDLHIPHAAFRLYCWYRKVCGNKNDSGKCWMKIDSICSTCHMDRRTVVSSRDQLEKEKLIKTERKIRPDGATEIIVTLTDVWNRNCEHIQNYNAVNKCTDKTTTRVRQNYNAADVQNYNANNNNMNKNNLNNSQHSSSTDSENGSQKNGNNGYKKNGFLDDKLPSEDKAKIRAQRLHKALSAKNKIMRGDISTERTIKSWSTTIRKFFIDNLVPADEFDSVLDWYCEHIGEQYVNGAYSAKSFCDAYVKIRDKAFAEYGGSAPPPEIKSYKRQTTLVDIFGEE